MPTTPKAGSAADRAVNLRPLPARPNLEHERKESKALLAQLRAGNRDAIARADARNTTARGATPRPYRLADAQLTVAREYGFTSWPRLVSYYEAVFRQEHSSAQMLRIGADRYESWPDALLADHRDRQTWVGQTLATFIPRFYGKSVTEVLDATVTLDEARLAVARRHCCPSWTVLAERAQHAPKREPRAAIGTVAAWNHHASPLASAAKLMAAGDLDGLAQLVAEHPSLLHPGDFGEPNDHAITLLALQSESMEGGSSARAIADWLIAQQDDPSNVLNRMLISLADATPENVRLLLDRGADPRWTPPNGISVLEHVLVRYLSGEAVDEIARRVSPPRAFWVAAGLGDVASVARYVGREGTLSQSARLHRPDFTAIGPMAVGCLPDASDADIIWEAAYVAAINQRMLVLDVLFDRGFPVDYHGWGSTLLLSAVMRQDVPLVEYLVGRGANIDLEGIRPGHSPRARAVWLYEHMPDDDTRRIAELCGAKVGPAPAAPTDAEQAAADTALLQRIVGAATDDAARLGLTEVGNENLFVGALREASALVLAMLTVTGTDIPRLRALLGNRVLPASDAIAIRVVPLRTGSAGFMSEVTALGARAGQPIDVSFRALHVLTRDSTGPVADLLVQAGTTATAVHSMLADFYGEPD